MAMFRGFNQATRANAPQLLAASQADQADETSKLKQVSDTALGAATLAGSFFMPVAAPLLGAGAKTLLSASNPATSANFAAALRQPIMEGVAGDTFTKDYGSFLPSYD